MEAEYVALCDATKEALYLDKLFKSLRILNDKPIIVNTDAKSAINHVKHNLNHARTKHFDVKLHFIKQVYKDKKIDILHVPTDNQLADLLTKPLGPIKHKKAIEMLGMTSFTP